MLAEDTTTQEGPSTPFRVIDGGAAFVAEAVFASTVRGEDHRTDGVWGWEQTMSVQGLRKPYPEAYDHIDAQLTQVVFRCGTAEYIFADPEVVAKAWLSYRKARRSYIAPIPNKLCKMTTDQKPPTYLSQVLDNKFFAVVLLIVSLALIYTGSLMLFADWDSYQDPWTARGSNRFVFIASAVIMAVCLLVPAFKKSYRDARKGINQGGY